MTAVPTSPISRFSTCESDVLACSLVGIGTDGNASRIESVSRLFLVGVKAAVRVTLVELEALHCKDGRLLIRFTLSDNSARKGCITGGCGGGPVGGGNGGGSCSSAVLHFPFWNHDARFVRGVPDAVEALRFLKRSPSSGDTLLGVTEAGDGNGEESGGDGSPLAGNSTASAITISLVVIAVPGRSVSSEGGRSTRCLPAGEKVEGKAGMSSATCVGGWSVLEKGFWLFPSPRSFGFESFKPRVFFVAFFSDFAVVGRLSTIKFGLKRRKLVFPVRVLADDDMSGDFSSHGVCAGGVISLIRGPVMLDHNEVSPIVSTATPVV